VLALVASTVSAQGSFPVVRLNEIVIDSRGGNPELEFIELHSPQANLPLFGLAVVVIQGRTDLPNDPPGKLMRRFDLPANAATDASGFYLIANERTAAEYKVTPGLLWPNAQPLLNDACTVALVLARDCPAEGEILSPTFQPESGVFDAVAVAQRPEATIVFFGALMYGPDGAYLPAGVARVRDGVKTGSASDWEFADIDAPPSGYNTPGSSNNLEKNKAVRANDELASAAAAVQNQSGTVATPVSQAGNSAAVVDASIPQWYAYNDQLLQQALSSQGFALVYVRSELVKRCLSFEQTFLFSEAARPHLLNRALFFINVNDPAMAGLHDALGVYRVPTMLFIGPNGRKEPLAISSYTTADEMLSFLKKR